jgi:hypothetical protein
MNKAAPAENEEFWTIPLQGREVSMCKVDYAVTLVFWTMEDAAEVRLGVPFAIREPGVDAAALNPEERRRDLGPVIDCFGKTVERLLIWKPDGRLDLTFTDGTQIEVLPHNDYEAWEVTGPGSLKFVCMPGGGEPAIWY